jgi:hypothetical protein
MKLQEYDYGVRLPNGAKAILRGVKEGHPGVWAHRQARRKRYLLCHWYRGADGRLICTWRQNVAQQSTQSSSEQPALSSPTVQLDHFGTVAKHRRRVGEWLAIVVLIAIAVFVTAVCFLDGS